MLGFETMTLAPIDRNVIKPSLLDKDEITWATPITPGCGRP